MNIVSFAAFFLRQDDFRLEGKSFLKRASLAKVRVLFKPGVFNLADPLDVAPQAEVPLEESQIHPKLHAQSA